LEKIIRYEIRKRVVYDVYEYNEKGEPCNTIEFYSNKQAEKYIGEMLEK